MKDGCSHCLIVSTMTLLAACSAARGQNAWPSSPNQLAYYDAAWARNLTWKDLNASIVSRDKFDDLDIVSVQFDAFDQPIMGPNGVVTIRWRQRAALVLPPAPLRHAKAAAFEIGDYVPGSKDDPGSYLGMAIRVAKAFDIPVLVQMWMPDVVERVDGSGYHDLQTKVLRRLLAAGIESAKDLPMDGRYLFNGNPLVKSDMVALTMLQRLVEKERGTKVTEIASLGGSKEGRSHWLLGAIDDRVTVLAPGGMYWHDTNEILDRYGKDWAWRFPWKGGEGPDYDGLRALFETAWKFGDWMINTEAGQMVRHTTTDPATWYEEIKARHVVVFGDLGIMPGQHDGPFPILAEKRPLAAFKHRSWRYLRLFDGYDDMGVTVIPQMADLLVNGITTPSMPDVEVHSVAERQVRVTASANVAPDLKTVVLALYAISPERGLRDREYWHKDVMRSVQKGRWQAVLPKVPEGHGLTLIVVVRERVVVDGFEYWRGSSSLPIERFALPEFNVKGPSWRD